MQLDFFRYPHFDNDYSKEYLTKRSNICTKISFYRFLLSKLILYILAKPETKHCSFLFTVHFSEFYAITLRFLLYVLVLLYVLFVKFLLFYIYTYRTIANYIFLLHEKSKNSKKFELQHLYVLYDPKNMNCNIYKTGT